MTARTTARGPSRRDTSDQVQHGAAQPAHVVEKGHADDAAVLDLSLVGTGRHRVEPVGADHVGPQVVFGQVSGSDPANRQVDAVAGDAGDLGVRWQAPGVDVELGDPDTRTNRSAERELT
jgi:hypothetical protein